MEIYPVKYIDDYHIRYDSLNQFYATVYNKIDTWNTALDQWSAACSAFAGMDDFQGAAADAAKAYIQETHGILVSSIKQTLQFYHAQLLLYITGHYQMESHTEAVIPRDILISLMGKLGGELWDNELLNDDVTNILKNIADICPLTPPSMEALQTSLEELRTDIKDYKEAFDNYEYSKYTLANVELQGLIDSLQAMVQTLTENAVEITSYQSESAFRHETVQQFMTQAQITVPYLSENQQGIQEGLAIQAAIYQKQQQEYEEACKERMDTGTAQMLGGGLGAAGTVAVIVIAAIAAPTLPALAVFGAGTCVFVCCTSDTMEGYENYQYGKAGDLTTAAINPVRDVCFDGDMEAYNDFKLVSQFALTVAGAWAGGATGYGLVAEVGRECVGDYASGQIAGEIADVFGFGYGGTMATEVIVETLIEGEYDGPNARTRNTPDVQKNYVADADINLSGNLMNNTVPVGIVDGKYGSMTDIDVGSTGLYETSYGKSSGKLDWDAIVSKKGETRVEHINRHAVPNISRETHGVFNGNPIDMVNDAWEQRHLVEPISDGMGGKIYNIPYKNAGYESGYINTGAQMDYITIVTMDESADLITAFPSLGDYHK